MPATTSEALSTPLLSLMQKMKYRSFLSSLVSVEIPGEDGVPLDKDVPLMHKTMRQLFKEYGLDENCQDFTGHAMALRLNDDYLDEPALETVKALKLYDFIHSLTPSLLHSFTPSLLHSFIHSCVGMATP